MNHDICLPFCKQLFVISFWISLRSVAKVSIDMAVLLLIMFDADHAAFLSPRSHHTALMCIGHVLGATGSPPVWSWHLIPVAWCLMIWCLDMIWSWSRLIMITITIMARLCYALQCDVMWCDVICDVIYIIWYDMTRHDIWYMLWYDIIRDDTIRYDTIHQIGSRVSENWSRDGHEQLVPRVQDINSMCFGSTFCRMTTICKLYFNINIQYQTYFMVL